MKQKYRTIFINIMYNTDIIGSIGYSYGTSTIKWPSNLDDLKNIAHELVSNVKNPKNIVIRSICYTSDPFEIES